jgi:hypothetical protein
MKRGLIGETVQGGTVFDRPKGCDRWIVLSLAAADRARQAGFTGVSVCASGCRSSVSRTLYFRDRHRRDWIVRVSDHFLPDRARRVHFNLISRDCLFGRDQLLAFIDRVGAETVEWFEPVGTEKRPSPRVMRRIQDRY